MIYELKIDLPIDKNAYETTIYKKETCGVSYMYEINEPFKQRAFLTLAIVAKDTKEVVARLRSQSYSETGIPITVNYEALQVYEQAKHNLNSEISTIQNTLYGASELTEEQKSALEEQLNSKQSELANMSEVQPIIEYKYKYTELANKFNSDGTLTPEGIEWAKGIEVRPGITLNDILIFP